MVSTEPTTVPISDGSGLVVTSPSTITSGTVGVAYSYQFTASGGTGSYTWSLESGSPTWLSITSSGLLSGIPPTGSSPQAQLTVKAQDNTASATKAITLPITAIGGSGSSGGSGTTGSTGGTATSGSNGGTTATTGGSTNGSTGSTGTTPATSGSSSTPTSKTTSNASSPKTSSLFGSLSGFFNGGLSGIMIFFLPLLLLGTTTLILAWDGRRRAMRLESKGDPLEASGLDSDLHPTVQRPVDQPQVQSPVVQATPAALTSVQPTAPAAPQSGQPLIPEGANIPQALAQPTYELPESPQSSFPPPNFG